MIIKLLKYKPYSNRENIGFDVVSSYEPYVVQTFNGINFIPGDGVNTSVIFNTSEANSSADYLLAVNDDGTTIDSRWFIMDAARTRYGQYKFSLYRDTLYDFKTEIANSTAYIKRGWITDSDNPLLFNQEEFTTNQILNRVDTLQNGIHGAWIVGYLSPNAEGKQLAYLENFNGHTLTDSEYKLFAGTEYFNDENPPKTFSSLLVRNSTNPEVVFPSAYSDAKGHYFTADATSGEAILGNYEEHGNWTPAGIDEATRKQATGRIAQTLHSHYDDWTTTLSDELISSLRTKYGTYTDYIDWNGKYVYYHGFTYKVEITSGDYINAQTRLNSQSIRNRVAQDLNATNDCIESGLTANSVKGYISGDISTHNIKFTRAPRLGLYNSEVPEAARRPVGKTQPYNIFAIPCGNEYLSYTGPDEEGHIVTHSVTTHENTAFDIALCIAQEISKMYTGSGALYDLQLVPYCPIKYYGSGTVIPSNMSWIYDHSTPGNIISGICWITDTELKNYAALDLSWHNPVTPTDTALNLKIVNQLYNCRIIAPNHGAIYEFNPARLGNKGASSQSAMNVVDISLTYKPYTPLIFIKPKIWENGLYGQTYGTDTRGLICAGDFSLPQTNDAWQTYQINNKNYLNAFNRQVESVELNNKYTKVKDIAGAISGTVSAAVSGGITGAAVGGPAGAAVGAIAGGLASGVAGALDVGMNEKLRADQLDLKKDMFNFDLQNIQAQPQTIAKVGAYDVLNSIFPLVETYCASNEEEAAFRQYLKYNGMKIGVISTLSNYKVSHRFIAADIIHIDLHEDTHLINTIREEVSKGFYDGRITNI